MTPPSTALRLVIAASPALAMMTALLADMPGGKWHVTLLDTMLLLIPFLVLVALCLPSR